MQVEMLPRPVTAATTVRASAVFERWQPTHWFIGDDDNRPVRIGPAGYVLTIGRRYRLLFAQPIREAKVTGFPSDFMKLFPAAETVTIGGGAYLAVPFRARLDYPRYLRPFVRPGIHPRRLTVECVGPDEQKCQVDVPVQFRHGWTWMYVVVLALATLGAIVVGLLTQAGKDPDMLTSLQASLWQTFTWPSVAWIIGLPMGVAMGKIIALDYIGGYCSTLGAGNSAPAVAAEGEADD